MCAAAALTGFLEAGLRAGPERVREWVSVRPGNLFLVCLLAIWAGAGSYGAAMGWWRDSQQAFYTGVKLPLVILLTTLGNGLLNGLLAPLLGLNVTFQQSFMLVLLTFAIASVVLGALSPVALFIVWNTPPLTADTTLVAPEYAVLQLTLAVFVALAGVMGNFRLLPLLRLWSGQAVIARNVLLAWLAGNLFLGSQIAWVLRPFIWDAHRPVEFIGPEHFRGSFFETVFHAAGKLIGL